MFSSPTFENLHKKLLFITSFLGFSPLTFSNSCQKYKLKVNCLATSICQLIWVVSYVLIIVPTHLISLHKSKDSQMIIFTIIIWLTSLMGTVCLGNYLWNCTEICQVWNGFPIYIKELEDKFVPRKVPNKLLSFLLVGSTALCISLGYLTSLHVFIFPTAGPYLFYSVPHRLVLFPLRIGYTCVFAVQANGITNLLAVYIAQGLFTYYTLTPILKEIKLGRKFYRTKDNLRTIPNLVHTYRCVGVLIVVLNIAFCKIFLPFEIIFGNLSLLCNVTLALFWETLDLDTSPFLVVVAAFAILGFSACLTMCGLLNVVSRKTVASWKIERWKGQADRMYMKRFKRSCRELGIKSWGMATVRPLAGLKYINSTGKATFRALLMLRKALVKSYAV